MLSATPANTRARKTRTFGALMPLNSARERPSGGPVTQHAEPAPVPHPGGLRRGAVQRRADVTADRVDRVPLVGAERGQRGREQAVLLLEDVVAQQVQGLDQP